MGQLVRRSSASTLASSSGVGGIPASIPPLALLRPPRAAAPRPRPIAAPDAPPSRLRFAVTSWPDPFAFSAPCHRLGVTPPEAGSRLESPRPAFW